MNIVWLTLTRECPLRCSFCFQTGNFSQKMDDATFGKILLITQGLAPSLVMLSGGEAVLHHRFAEMQFEKIRIPTSGIPFANPANVKKVKNAEMVISVKGLKNEHYQGMTRGFDMAMQGVKNIYEAGFEFKFSAVMTAV